MSDEKNYAKWFGEMTEKVNSMTMAEIENRFREIQETEFLSRREWMILQAERDKRKKG